MMQIIISNGICFNGQNRTYFAYSDRQHNSVFVHNFITQIDYPVSPYDCLNTMECPQLLLLGNRYMIVRDANNVVVLDTTSNFSLVLNKTSGWATQTLFTVSHMSANDVSTVAPLTMVATNTADEVLTSTVVPTDIQTDTPEHNVPSTGLPNEVTINAVPTTTTDISILITEQSESTDLQLALIIVGSIAALVIIVNIIAITVYFFKRYRKHHR